MTIKFQVAIKYDDSIGPAFQELKIQYDDETSSIIGNVSKLDVEIALVCFLSIWS